MKDGESEKDEERNEERDILVSTIMWETTGHAGWWGSGLAQAEVRVTEKY